MTERAEMAQLQHAIDRYAAIHGIDAANALMLSVLASTHDPLLADALRNLRQPSNGARIKVGVGIASEIMDAIARVTKGGTR